MGGKRLIVNELNDFLLSLTRATTDFLRAW